MKLLLCATALERSKGKVRRGPRERRRPSNHRSGSLPPRTHEAAAASDDVAAVVAPLLPPATQAPPSPAAAPNTAAASHRRRAAPSMEIAMCLSSSPARIPGRGCASRDLAADAALAACLRALAGASFKTALKTSGDQSGRGRAGTDDASDLILDSRRETDDDDEVLEVEFLGVVVVGVEEAD